jgi:hypothetical protein
MINGRLLNNYSPAAIWLGYHAVVPNWKLSFLSLLMLIRAIVVLFCFLQRDEVFRRAPRYQIVVAWISTFLPTLMLWLPGVTTLGFVGEVVAILGMTMFCFTCLDLGKSFGVSPAVRSPVSGGVYKYVSHPMYISHAIVEAGVLIASPTIWNFTIAVAAWSLYAVRANWEKELLRDYERT